MRRLKNVLIWSQVEQVVVANVVFFRFFAFLFAFSNVNIHVYFKISLFLIFFNMN